MTISNLYTLELEIRQNHYLKEFNDVSDFLNDHESSPNDYGRFLVVKTFGNEHLSKEHLIQSKIDNSNNLISTKPRTINSQYSYDNDDKIKIHLSNFKDENCILNVVCIRNLSKEPAGKKKELDLKFIVKKRRLKNRQTITLIHKISSLFCTLYNRKIKIDSTPKVIMKIEYISDSKYVITYPMNEIIK